MINTVVDSISVERLQEIEAERRQTQSDPMYIQWMKELNVSGSYVDRTPIHNAQHAMMEWDISRLRIK